MARAGWAGAETARGIAGAEAVVEAGAEAAEYPAVCTRHHPQVKHFVGLYDDCTSGHGKLQRVRQQHIRGTLRPRNYWVAKS